MAASASSSILNGKPSIGPETAALLCERWDNTMQGARELAREMSVPLYLVLDVVRGKKPTPQSLVDRHKADMRRFGLAAYVDVGVAEGQSEGPTARELAAIESEYPEMAPTPTPAPTTSTTEETKTCSRCKKPRLITEFRENPAKSDGRNTVCMTCIENATAGSRRGWAEKRAEAEASAPDKSNDIPAPVTALQPAPTQAAADDKAVDTTLSVFPGASASPVSLPSVTVVESAPPSTGTPSERAMLTALLDRVPLGGTWSCEERRAWLAAFAGLINLFVPISDSPSSERR